MIPTVTPSSAPLVLVVDDDPDMSDLLCELLVDDGYRVATLPGSRDLSPEEVGRQAADLVVTDSLNRDAAGMTATLAAWRAEPLLFSTPIVLCTGAVREVPEMADAVEALGVRVVLKPFDIDHLLAEVRAALGVLA